MLDSTGRDVDNAFLTLPPEDRVQDAVRPGPLDDDRRAAMLPPSRFVETLQDEAPVADEAVPETARPSGPLTWAISLCLAVVLVAFGATTYLSRVLDAGAQRQREARAALLDPETTGSIGAAARTHLDPCVVPGLRR